MSVNCAHGHSAGCACDDCKIAQCWTGHTSYEAIAALREPRKRALVACQIQSGPGRSWMNRTYEFVRIVDGQWIIDVGEGVRESRQSWDDVLDWLRRMRPRDIEMLEVT